VGRTFRSLLARRLEFNRTVRGLGFPENEQFLIGRAVRL
jgi:hypothetical protein